MDEELKSLLLEIRDNQKEHIALARAQVERSNRQIEESIALQKEAVARTKTITWIAFPGILFCIALVLYLVFRYLI